MRLSSICLSLCLLAPSVLANVLAGPYQSVLLWYAYRMDVMVNEPADRLIAVGCVGTGPGNSCLFDEFLRYIQMTSKKTPLWTGSTTVGDDLTPDVVSTANELATRGVAKTSTRYTNTYKTSKLCETLKDKPTVTYSELLGAIVNSIQKCRAKVATMSGIDIDRELSGARRALTITHQARLADNAGYIIKGVNNILGKMSATWTIETTPSAAAEGAPFTWEEVNTEATISAHPDASSDMMDAVKQYIASYGTDSTDRFAKSHMDAVSACQQGESRLMSDSTC